MKKKTGILAVILIIAIIGIYIVIVTKQKENYKQSYAQSIAEKEFLEWVKQNETDNIIHGEIYIDADGIKTIESSSGTKIKCKRSINIGLRGEIKEQWSPYYIFTGISDLFWINNNNNTLSISKIGYDGYDEYPQFTKLIYAPGNKYTGMYVEFKKPEKAIMLNVKLPFKNFYYNNIPITLQGTFLIIKQTSDGISLLSDETIKVNNWRGDSGDFNPNLIGTSIILNNSTNELKNNIDNSNVTDKNILRTTLVMPTNCYSVKNAEGEFLNKNDYINKSTMPYTMIDEERIQVPYSKSYTFTNFNYKSNLSRIYVTIRYKEYKNIKDYTEEYQVFITKEMNKVIINPEENTVYIAINKSDNLSIYLPSYKGENGYLYSDKYELKVNGSYIKIKCDEKEDFLYSDGEIIVNYTAGKKYTIIKEN